MKCRKIPAEEYIEFVIEDGLKNVPELVDKYPVETMYKRLNKNVKRVFESRDSDVTYSAYYNRDDESICIINKDNKFNIETLKDDDKFHSAIHESIHALISKMVIKRPNSESVKRKIINYVRDKSFYAGMFLRFIDKDNSVPIKVYGIVKNDKKSVKYRNITGFFCGDCKYKYKGSLISRFFYMKKAFAYRSEAKAIGLEEGFTEWLTEKVTGGCTCYKNELGILKQIETVLGTRKTMDISDGNLPNIRALLDMDREPFYEMIYRMDEALKAKYRSDDFEKKLEILKRDSEESKNKSLKEKISQKLSLVKDDLLFYDSKKKSKIETVRNYYRKIINQNLTRAEEIMIETVLLPAIYESLNKEKIEFDDVKNSIKIFESIREHMITSDMSLSGFMKNYSYKDFRKVFLDMGERFFEEYKDQLDSLSEKELADVFEVYDFFEGKDEDGEFYKKLEESKDKNFYKNILPEIKERFSLKDKISFQEIDDFIDEKGVLLKEDELWKYFFGDNLSEKEIENIKRELRLYSVYGVKLKKEDLILDPYSKNEEYDVVIDDRYVGRIEKESAELFLEDRSRFKDDRFYMDSSLNIGGFMLYEDYLSRQEEINRICKGNEELKSLLDEGDLSLFEAEAIMNGEYHNDDIELDAEKIKKKFSFKSLVGKILRKKSIDVFDVEDVSKEIDNNGKMK